MAHLSFRLFSIGILASSLSFGAGATPPSNAPSVATTKALPQVVTGDKSITALSDGVSVADLIASDSRKIQADKATDEIEAKIKFLKKSEELERVRQSMKGGLID